MAKKQTRRSISVSGRLYDRLRLWCDQNHTSMSNVVEVVVGKHIGLEARDAAPSPSPVVPRKEAMAPNESRGWIPSVQLPARIDKIKEVAEAKKESTPGDPIASKIFTF